MFEQKLEVLSRVVALIPHNASLLTGSSKTLQDIGFEELLIRGNHGQVLMNFTAYTEWSTMLLPQQENPPQLGDFITLRLKLPGGLDYTFSPVVITLENENHFAW